MKPKVTVAAAVVLACAVVGCSKRGQSQKTDAEDSTQTKAIAASESTSPKAFDGEGFTETAAKITGPVSFADGEAAYQTKNYAEAV
jgi:hypothetical protein